MQLDERVTMGYQGSWKGNDSNSLENVKKMIDGLNLEVRPEDTHSKEKVTLSVRQTEPFGLESAHAELTSTRPLRYQGIEDLPNNYVVSFVQGEKGHLVIGDARTGIILYLK